MAQGITASLPFCQRAVEIAPGFALAYVAMGEDYSILNEGKRGAEYARKAYDLREKCFAIHNIPVPRLCAWGDLAHAARSGQISSAKRFLAKWDSFRMPRNTGPTHFWIG